MLVLLLRVVSGVLLLLIAAQGVLSHRRRQLYPLQRRLHNSYWLHALWAAFLLFLAAEFVHVDVVVCVLHSVIVHAPLAVLGAIYTVHAWNVHCNYKVAANQVRWCLQRRLTGTPTTASNKCTCKLGRKKSLCFFYLFNLKNFSESYEERKVFVH